MQGAPETVAERLAVVPEGYHRAYKHYACQGARVLALAVKKVPDDITLDQMRAMTRGDIERDLEFVGFSIFSCPVKREVSLRAGNPFKGASSKLSHARRDGLCAFEYM